MNNFRINRNISFYGILIIAFLAFNISYSYAMSFKTSVSKNQVEVGEQIQVTYTLENANGRNFRPPTYRGFSIVEGPFQSDMTQIINGHVSRSLSYSFILRAEAEGKYNLPGASIIADGNSVTSNFVSVIVTKGRHQAQSQNRSSTRNSGQDDQSIQEQANKIISKNLFIKLQVNKTAAYKGEPIVAEYKLYVNPDLILTSIGNPKMPVFNGFWSQEININQIQFTGHEVINGIAYRVADLKKVVLIPQQTGELTVDPLQMEFGVRLRVENQRQHSRDPFDAFFDDPFFNGASYRDFAYKSSSRTIKIKAKPLPAGAPKDFAGAVGSYKLDAWLDKNHTRTNEPVNLNIKISGEGNLKLLQPLAINLPPDIETFDPNSKDNISVGGNGLSGSKSWEHILVPRNPGNFKIAPVNFTYFDIKKNKYITLSSKEFQISVEKGNAQYYTLNRQDVKQLSNDISFLKNPPASLKRAGEKFFGSWEFYLLSISPLLMFIGFLYYRRKKQDKEDNSDLYKNKAAGKIIKKRLALAKGLMLQGKEQEFYEEISKSLWLYLSDKLLLPFSLLNRDNIIINLNQKGVDNSVIENLINILDYCEFARFSSIQDDNDINRTYNDAAQTIADLEGALK